MDNTRILSVSELVGVIKGLRENLDFSDALRWLKEGKRVQRADWGHYLVRVGDTGIMDFYPDSDAGFKWRARSSDLLASDWRVV